MSGGMFVLHADNKWTEMKEQPYDSEALLQELLAQHPSLLAGDQINPTAPRKWLLVKREVGVPAVEGGGGRFAVDHLFLDQDAIPTLVEVKRSTDTRIRREVVGQMLDYAANAVVYWPIEDIRTAFIERCSEENSDPDAVLLEHLGAEGTTNDFWASVKTNLAAGKIRMVFVADKIPTELQRIVEFLNEQMKSAEVLAIEVRQYGGDGLKTLVPRVIGQTAQAQQTKTLGEKRQWDEATFFDELERRKGSAASEVARAILAWAKQADLRIWWGQGKVDGSFYAMLDHHGVSHYTIAVWTYGNLAFQFQGLALHPPFRDEAKRFELLNRLNAIVGISIPPTGISRYPSIALTVLEDPRAREQLLEVLNWVINEIRTT